MKHAKLCDKLREIVLAIDHHGSTNQTRLTVLKKWFEVPSRLSAFGIFIANQALRRTKKTTGPEAKLFREAHALLADADIFAPKLPHAATAQLHACLRAFQNEYRPAAWGAVRVIRDHNVLLVECGLQIYLRHGDAPADGYRLAANYCENYDSRYGSNLNGPSRGRIKDIIGFVEAVDACEE